jgi:hypothetical protein
LKLCVAVPVLGRGEVLGVVTLYSAQERGIDPTVTEKLLASVAVVSDEGAVKL